MGGSDSKSQPPSLIVYGQYFGQSFRALKQNLKIKTFAGTSANALQIQMWTALIALFIVRYLQLRSRLQWHLSRFVALLRHQLFVYRDLWRLFGTPFEGPPPPALFSNELHRTFSQFGQPSLVTSTLGETQVLVANRPAPLLYVSKGQTSFIVPYETAVGANAQVVVRYKGFRSVPFTVPVVTASPGLFSANSSGTGQGVILNQDGGFNNAQNPAAKGSVIVLFLTGEGETDPPGSDGQIANGVFLKPALPVRVAGLMQVNA